MSKYSIRSTEPSRWGLNKKGQLYFIKLSDKVIVKFHKWYDGAAMMIFTPERGYGIKLRASHIEALISYLRGDMKKVREIVERQNDLDYIEELEEGMENAPSQDSL